MSRTGTPTVENIPYERTAEALVRPIPPGGTASRNAHITVPHPNEQLRKKGWRQEWIILGSIMAMAVYACYWLAPLLWEATKIHYGLVG